MIASNECEFKSGVKASVYSLPKAVLEALNRLNSVAIDLGKCTGPATLRRWARGLRTGSADLAWPPPMVCFLQVAVLWALVPSLHVLSRFGTVCGPVDPWVASLATRHWLELCFHGLGVCFLPFSVLNHLQANISKYKWNYITYNKYVCGKCHVLLYFGA